MGLDRTRPVQPVRLLRRALTGRDHIPAIAGVAGLLARSGGEARAGDLARQTGLSRRQMRRTLHAARRLELIERRGQLVRLAEEINR